MKDMNGHTIKPGDWISKSNNWIDQIDCIRGNKLVFSSKCDGCEPNGTDEPKGCVGHETIISPNEVHYISEAEAMLFVLTRLDCEF